MPRVTEPPSLTIIISSFHTPNALSFDEIFKAFKHLKLD